MRLVCISDTHGMHRKWYRFIGVMPAGDILVVAGDITTFGQARELSDFNDWIGMLKRVYGYKEAVVIAGNHDRCLAEMHPNTIRRDWLGNCRYLCDESIVIDGIKFHGSPWTPTYGSWSFMKDDEELYEMWQATIPTDTNVLITHGPPIGMFDKTLQGVYAGSRKLALIASSLANLKIHVFGHIHEAYGKTEGFGGISCNASVVNVALNPTNQPQVIEI